MTLIQDIDHIAIVVKKIEERLGLYTEVLGCKLLKIEEVPHMHVRVAMLESAEGTTQVELVEPTTEGTGIQRFLKKKGEGFHHLCFVVNDLQKTLQTLKSQGIRLIDETPREGKGGSRVAFLHPESFHGLLVELKERQKHE
jgi:methylmalonyl-CoA/ethylmalonyl-CoA epimerase